jgi:predicted hydrolase (HD superfamily)
MEFMSPSEESAKLSGVIVELREQIGRTMQAGELAAVPREDVTSLVTEAIKLYAAYTEELESEISPTDSSVSTTEAMVVACALLRAQHMNPFDLALWFQRTTPKAL